MWNISVFIRTSTFFSFCLLIFTIPAVSAENVNYKIDKGSYDYCDGQAKYLLTIYIGDSTKSFRALVRAYFLDSNGNKIFPCFPGYHTRVVDVKPQYISKTEFYFKDLSKSATLHILVREWEGESKLYTFPISKINTITTTFPSPPTKKTSENPLTFIFAMVDSYLIPFYNSYIPKTIPYNYFRVLAFLLLVSVAIIAVAIVRKSRKEAYTILVDVSEYERPKLVAECAVCGKKVYMPYKCSYCGKYFCDDHILPPKHNCSGIGEWRTKGPLPSGVSWEHTKGGTYYRKH